ncbi:MAG TPA: hypothetical protein VFX72_07150 [Usitatibacteraceae bacterium]|nr:hypothetical protein [Usitatibacteraceae bacterium]
MDSQVVLARTPQGAEALARQDHDLPRALRHALILVDGRSTVEKLEHRGSMIPDFPAALRELLARGLVVPVGHGGPPTGPGGAANGRNLVNSLVATAQTILGDKAGKVVKKIEEAGHTREELLAAVEGCYKLIRLTIDEARAEEFRAAAKDVIARGG